MGLYMGDCGIRRRDMRPVAGADWGQLYGVGGQDVVGLFWEFLLELRLGASEVVGVADLFVSLDVSAFKKST
jgi:hypothetical protein